MVRIRKVDVSALDKPKLKAAPKELSPKARARLAQQRQFRRLLGQLNGANDVFEVRLGKEDKALTVRQRLMKAAQEKDKDIVVRKSDAGWFVALATPERRSRRGRRRAAAAG